MIYEYANAAGERREIVASVQDRPPERIRCLSGDKINPKWREASCNDTDDVLHTRVYSLQPPIVKKYGVEYAGQALPVSRALPLDLTPGTVENRGGHTVLKHADGGYTDLKGRRLIATKKDVERAEAATGLKRD